MSIADDLQKLQTLRGDRALSDVEFAQAKAAVLAGSSAPRDSQSTEDLAAQLAEARCENELMRIDQDWVIERQRYFIYGPYGGIPRTEIAWAVVLVGVLIGVGVIVAYLVMNTSPTSPILLLFGMLIAISQIGVAARLYTRAKRYDAAYEAYLRRRRKRR